MVRTRIVVVVAVLAVVAALVPATGGAAAATAPSSVRSAAQAPRWQQRLDTIVAGRDVGVSVRLGGADLYNHAARESRIPASNQKLLVTMALFDAVKPSSTIATRAAARTVRGGRVEGNLWLLGRGDPSVTGGGSFGHALPFRPSRLHRLARRIAAAGITRITGRVKGAVSYFRHDWSAPGWRSYYPAQYVPLASGLAFEGNVEGGRHIRNPELRAAAALTRNLRRLGVSVAGSPGAGDPPRRLDKVTAIRSVPIRRLVRFMNRKSSNFFAEMMGKKLAAATREKRGTIARGAAATQAWAARHGVDISAYDASGLSFSNRVAPRGLTRLLDGYAMRPGPSKVRATLAGGGQGTLENRLHDVRVKAKTGTLPNHSALSGYVYLERRDRWAAFSILSKDMPKYSAVAMEDKIVRLLADRGR